MKCEERKFHNLKKEKKDANNKKKKMYAIGIVIIKKYLCFM